MYSLVGALADHGSLGGADSTHDRPGGILIAARHRRDLLTAVEASRVGLWMRVQ